MFWMYHHNRLKLDYVESIDDLLSFPGDFSLYGKLISLILNTNGFSPEK